MNAIALVRTRRLSLALAFAAVSLSLGLGGCRNWCHTSSGPQAKGPGAQCVTPGERDAARHVN